MNPDEPASMSQAFFWLAIVVLALIAVVAKPHPALPPPAVPALHSQPSAQTRIPAHPQTQNPQPPPTVADPPPIDRDYTETLAALEAQSGYLASQISQLESQRDYYRQKASSLTQRSAVRSPSYYSTSNGYYSNGTYSNSPYYIQSGPTIHSDPAQASRAEMQAEQIARQIPALQSQRAKVEAQLQAIRSAGPRSSKSI